jgi:hypothetical protein
MRAMDALEKICRQHPEWLQGYVDRMQSGLASSSQPSVQWHLAQIYGQVDLTAQQKRSAINWLKDLISDTDVDWIVSANSMEALMRFTRDGSVPEKDMVRLLKIQKNHKSNAVVRKASKFLYDIFMATQNKTQENENSVNDFVASLGNEQVISDCHQLIKLMSKISGHQPRMWGPSIIGFDKYHYKYASGRQGDAPILGFSPRKGKLTIYMDAGDPARSPELFASLGKHTTSKVCIYIRRMSDIDPSVLTQILKKSYDYTKSLAPDEHISRV